MEQLLRIRTIPISFDFQINHAKYKIDSDPATYEMTRNQGGLSVIRNVPARLKMDTVEARASMGLMSGPQLVRKFAQKGIESGYEATATAAREGNMMMNYYNGGCPMAEIAFQRMQDNIATGLGFIPSVSVNIEYEAQDFQMKYEADQIYFNWRTCSSPDIDYIPGNIEYSVKEYPHLEIEYIGGFMYVPPSANPEYEEPQFDISA
jgi:hypothetical protein